MNNEFLLQSIDFQNSHEIKDLQKQGIFFTPKLLRNKLWNRIGKYIKKNKRILEPSVGTGEFIHDIRERYNGVKLHLDAIELNEELYNSLESQNLCNIKHSDFLTHTFSSTYDVILGNPPYFEVSKKNHPKYVKLFPEWFNGRTNIYTLFILKCISLLKTNGILALIVPLSWMNGKYFEYLRSQLDLHGRMLYMEDFTQIQKFMKTKQPTMLFVFQKGNYKNDKYRYKVNNNIFYSFNKQLIKKLLKNTKTIKELGGKVKTGSCVWNQMKNVITDDSSKGIPLIYSGNIQDNKVKLVETMTRGKKQYIKVNKQKQYTEPTIIINRGFGKGSAYKLSFALCELPVYACENHINVICAPTREILDIIYTSLHNPITKKWCGLFVGNGQLSKTEVEEYMPVFIS